MSLPTGDSLTSTGSGRGATLILPPWSSRRERNSPWSRRRSCWQRSIECPPQSLPGIASGSACCDTSIAVLADPGTKNITGPGVEDAADGLLVYFLGPPEEAGSCRDFRKRQTRRDRHNQLTTP